MKLKGKVAIVTGSGVGMGRSVAIRYAEEGAKVIVAEINNATGQETADYINKSGGNALFVPTDVSKEEQVKNLVKQTVSHFGRIDVLYNNVAVILPEDTRVHEITTETWMQVTNINYHSAFFCAKQVITEMINSGGGSIIMVGSPTAVVGCAPEISAYSTSKAGVHSLARVIAAGYGRDGIRANIIIPGTMDTPMNGPTLANPENVEKFKNTTFLGRLGTSHDVDGLAVFLASEDSAYCTGAEFTADGGLTAM